MSFEARWKLMADLVTELRRSGESIPADIMKNLRSAKTMIEILKVNRSHSENLLRIEEYLNDVESYLIFATKNRFGTKYVDEWMSRLLKVQRGDQAEETRRPTKFPLGVPRDKHWVRIRVSKEIPLEKIKQLSEEIELTNKIQEDGCLLVYGEENKMKRFVKKMAEILHESKLRC